jgi:hypothetical protein
VAREREIEERSSEQTRKREEAVYPFVVREGACKGMKAKGIDSAPMNDNGNEGSARD